MACVSPASSPPAILRPQSFLTAMQERVTAKADIKATLGSYKYYDSVGGQQG